MKNSQKGSMAVVLSLIVVFILIIAAGYLYFKPVKNLQVQNEATDQPAEMTTPAYDLMKTTLSKLGVSNVNVNNIVLSWNTEGTKVNYPGYSFVVDRSPAENLQIAQTWKNTGSLDKLDIRSRFINELKANGFTEDMKNSGDATFNTSNGYVKNNLVCLIKHKVTTPPEQVGDTADFSTITTIICADKK